jgi:hypothetical protein
VKRAKGRNNRGGKRRKPRNPKGAGGTKNKTLIQKGDGAADGNSIAVTRRGRKGTNGKRKGNRRAKTGSQSSNTAGPTTGADQKPMWKRQNSANRVKPRAGTGTARVSKKERTARIPPGGPQDSRNVTPEAKRRNSRRGVRGGRTRRGKGRRDQGDQEAKAGPHVGELWTYS